MKIFRLRARKGFLRRRLWSWFEAAPAGPTVKYDGWVWDPVRAEYVPAPVAGLEIIEQVPGYPKPALEPRPELPAKVDGWQWSDSMQEWFETPFRKGHYEEQQRPLMPTWIPKETEKYYAEGWYWSVRKPGWVKDWSWAPDKIWISDPRPPMPEYLPEPAGPKEVEGWSWSESEERWIATIIVGQRIGYMPPRSFPPEVEYAQIVGVYPMTEQYALFQKQLLDAGLTQTEANRIGKMMVDGFWNMSRSALEKDRAALYRESFNPVAVQMQDKLEKVGVYAAAILAAAIVGLLIGSIMDRLVTPGEENVVLVGGVITFLLQGDDWIYSREIGRSVKGRRYFSCCDEIGTEYARLKRGYGVGHLDVLDFPGGFVEIGYKFPYFVKYTWVEWDLEYAGMLESVGADMYVLKVGREYTGAIIGPASMVPADEWCPDFRFYL